MRACDVCESKDGVVAYCVEGAREGAAKGERRLQPTATFLDLCPEHARLATAETLLKAIKAMCVIGNFRDLTEPPARPIEHAEVEHLRVLMEDFRAGSRNRPWSAWLASRVGRMISELEKLLEAAERFGRGAGDF